jgi:hypothetical protein
VFSGEVETGSGEENASTQKSGLMKRFSETPQDSLSQEKGAAGCRP